MIAAFMLSYIFQQEIWFYHLYPMVAMSAVALFWLMYRCIVLKSKCFFYGVFITVFGIFAFVFLEITPVMGVVYNPESPYYRLIHYSDKYARNGSVYCFVATTLCTSYLLQYAQVQSSSRFPSFWMIPGMVIKSYQSLTGPERHRLNNDAKKIQTLVTEDFEKNPPQLVFVSVNPHPFFFGPYQFDYVSFFSQNKTFREIWSNYHYQKKIGNYAVYLRS